MNHLDQQVSGNHVLKYQLHLKAKMYSHPICSDEGNASRASKVVEGCCSKGWKTDAGFQTPLKKRGQS